MFECEAALKTRNEELKSIRNDMISIEDKLGKTDVYIYMPHYHLVIGVSIFSVFQIRA